MTDTPSDVAEFYRRLLMRRSGVERLKMGSDMFDAARTLVRASIVASGCVDSADLQVRIFLRTYGRDFDSETAARIATRIRERYR